MELVRCSKCGSIGYSATRNPKCDKCGSRCVPKRVDHGKKRRFYMARKMFFLVIFFISLLIGNVSSYASVDSKVFIMFKAGAPYRDIVMNLCQNDFKLVDRDKDGTYMINLPVDTDIDGAVKYLNSSPNVQYAYFVSIEEDAA